MRKEKQEKRLHREGHYMGKVLHKMETIWKRDYIETGSYRGGEIYIKETT